MGKPRILLKTVLVTELRSLISSIPVNGTILSDALKKSVIEIIYSEAERTGMPVFLL